MILIQFNTHRTNQSLGMLVTLSNDFEVITKLVYTFDSFSYIFDSDFLTLTASNLLQKPQAVLFL